MQKSIASVQASEKFIPSNAQDKLRYSHLVQHNNAPPSWWGTVDEEKLALAVSCSEVYGNQAYTSRCIAQILGQDKMHEFMAFVFPGGPGQQRRQAIAPPRQCDGSANDGEN